MELELGVRFGDEERSIGGGPRASGGEVRLTGPSVPGTPGGPAPAGGGDSTSGRDREEIPKKAPPAPTPTKMQVDLG